MVVSVLLYYSEGSEPVFTGLPHVPRVGDEVKRFGLKPYKVHRVVWYLDGGYPRIYLYEPTNID